MKRKKRTHAALFVLLGFFAGSAFSQNVTVVAPTSAAAEGLNLQAVAEIFKEAKDLETFEEKLNDPELGINNLDLDNNGEVDFIRVVEETAEDVHVIILQVPMGENDFQDVATIEVEKNGEQDYNMQVCGNPVIYGPDYYIAPVRIHVYAWPIVPWIFRPVYRPYRSPFYFGHYPHWWRPWHPLATHKYRHHTVHYRTNNIFVRTQTTHVTRVTKVNYHPSSSTRVKKQTHIIHHNGDSKPALHSGKEKERNSQVSKQRTGADTRRDHQSDRDSKSSRTKKSSESQHGKKSTDREREVPRRDRNNNR
jgi:hypothetical protein